jgi:hypothetical protein
MQRPPIQNNSQARLHLTPGLQLPCWLLVGALHLLLLRNTTAASMLGEESSHLQAWAVCVCSNHVEWASRLVLLPNGERHQGGHVASEEVLASCKHMCRQTADIRTIERSRCSIPVMCILVQFRRCEGCMFGMLPYCGQYFTVHVQLQALQ